MHTFDLDDHHNTCLRDHTVIVANHLHTHPAFLHTLGNHDDVMDILFPDHLPEVVFSPWKGALRGDVLPAEVIPL